MFHPYRPEKKTECLINFNCNTMHTDKTFWRHTFPPSSELKCAGSGIGLLMETGHLFNFNTVLEPVSYWNLIL
jgi:hypothetical protein